MGYIGHIAYTGILYIIKDALVAVLIKQENKKKDTMSIGIKRNPSFGII
tara:strand:+ start:346 stop:492 length:147 start_codon:yes stop_codon:yes gene_type:complete